ncbi:MAG: hypothetical protein RI958_445 [Actinomycetota bacterium]|jgi:hypothetical protein
MTVTVLPRGAHRPTPTAAGKLAGTLLSVAVAGMAEPGRFRRGRAYATDRAVTRIDIDAGSVAAQVQGSERQPYLVRISAPSVERPGHGSGAPLERGEVMALVPDVDEISTWCSCPDGEVPCKHAVAALLVLADEIGPRPELLIAWRCGPDDERPRAAVGGQSARRAERHLRLAPSPPPPTPFVSPEWEAFEGRSSPPPPAMPDDLRDRPVVVGAEIVDRLDVGAIIRSAIDAIRQAGT